MKTSFKRYIMAAVLTATAGTMMAQDLTSAYFTDDFKYRHDMNPAYGNDQGYVAIPVLGNFNFKLQGSFGVGDVLFYGRGAGKLPTASAVVGDIIDCLKHRHTVLALTWEDSAGSDFIEHYKQVETSMYVRIKADNAEELKPAISELFGKLIYLERSGRPENELAFITPTMKEADIDSALTILSHSAEIASKIRLL